MKRSATPLPSGLSHEGGRSFDSQAFDFVLEIAGHIVGAMIVTQLQSTCHPGRDGSEAPMHTLAHRLQGLEAIGRPRCMNADDFRVGVFHGDEDIGPAFPDGDRLRHVRSPHFIDLIGDDRPIVRLGLSASNAMRREQAVLTHHPSHTAGARANARADRRDPAIEPCRQHGACGRSRATRSRRKVKRDWEAWNTRSLAEEPIVRLILDGTVVRVRLDRKATSISLLVVIGVRADGQKVLLAVKSMGGESAEAWRTVLDDLIKRELFWALLASGQITMRKIDGWQTITTKFIDQPIDLAA